MKESVITLKVVHINSRYPKGAFEAHYNNGTGSKSKQCALHVHDAEIAYQMVDLWAEDAAKETGYKYVKTSQAKLQKMIDTGSARPYGASSGNEKRPTDGISTGTNRSLLSSQKYLKAEIKRVFSTIGYERLKELFKIGNKEIEMYERERNNRVRNLDKAKENMAKSMYQTYLDTGVDMSEFCSDDEIVKEFNKLQLQAK